MISDMIVILTMVAICATMIFVTIKGVPHKCKRNRQARQIGYVYCIILVAISLLFSIFILTK